VRLDGGVLHIFIYFQLDANLRAVLGFLHKPNWMSDEGANESMRLGIQEFNVQRSTGIRAERWYSAPFGTFCTYHEE